MLTHGGLVNYIPAAVKLYDLKSTDRVLQFSSVSFDIAIEEMYPTWAAGATTSVTADEATSDVADDRPAEDAAVAPGPESTEPQVAPDGSAPAK